MHPREFAAAKMSFMKALERELLLSYEGTLKRELEEIFMKQRKFTPSIDAYEHAGVYFSKDPYYLGDFRNLPKGSNVEPLHATLIQEHEQVYKDFTNHRSMWERTKQTLNTIVSKAQIPQDLRDMLPDYVLRLVFTETPIHGLTRSRPDLFTVDKSIAVMHWSGDQIARYESIAAQLETYVGFRLL